MCLFAERSVRVTVGDLGLCCCVLVVFRALINSICLLIPKTILYLCVWVWVVGERVSVHVCAGKGGVGGGGGEGYVDVCVCGGGEGIWMSVWV